MQQLFTRLKYAMIGALIFILVLFYFGVFSPLKQELKQRLHENFINSHLRIFF